MEVFINKRRGGNEQSRGPRINDMIRVPEVRLIEEGGEAFGVLPIDEARRISQEKGLDLVEVSPNAKPPVIKLIDYGKFKYKEQKKSAEAKKKQAKVILKEVQFRPNIEKHDLEVKLKRVEKFLGQGDKVKLVMMFRGREMAYQAQGLVKFKEMIEQINNDYHGVTESTPKIMGNRIFAMVAPSKKKP